MTTIYKSTRFDQDNAPVPVEKDGDVKVLYDEFDLTAALALNNRIQFFKLPKGHRPVNIFLHTTDLDTGATPTIALDVGYTGHSTLNDPDAFIDGSTIGQAGGQTFGPNVATFGGFDPDTNDLTIEVLIQTAPQVGATTGKVRLCLSYTKTQAAY